MPCRLLHAILVLAFVLAMNPTQTLAITDDNEFVRTANIFLMGGSVLDDSLQQLAKFDLLVIPVECQVYNKSFFPKIRKLNPDIVILPYVATVSWNDLYWTDPLHRAMSPNIKTEWWLKDAEGKQLSVWPNTRALNLNTGWVSYLAQHVKNDVLSTGLWDGVFYDEVQDSISWVGKPDVNQDGKADTASEADVLWANNYKKLFETTRKLIGEAPIMITNGSSNPVFSPFVNGRMFETFPSSRNTLAEWKNMTGQYLALEQTVKADPIHIINVNTDNTNGMGNANDYKSVRFGLTTTLLGDGYFSYDHGTYDHAVIWTYDEYDAYLGAAKSDLHNAINPQKTQLDEGVWMREFEQGTVIVNATPSSQTVKLDGDFEKLHGAQDPKVNDGSIVSEVKLAAKDGIILLRPIEQILDATFRNGSFARVFDSEGKTKRTGFFVYDSAQRGGTQVVSFDTDNDGKRETVVANETYVSIYDDNGHLHAKFAPYTQTYDRGINISVGDLENDGSVEIVTGTENGGGPQVRVFNGDGMLINPGFFAYDKAFRGGVNVAIGDLNGDHINEIITGAGAGGGPHVRVFNKNGTLINPGFFAYDKTFRGGVNISVGDVDADGTDEIITGPGSGGSPLARIFDRNGTRENEFYIFDSTQRDGLEVIVADVDDDGRDEVIGLTTDVFTMSGGWKSEVGSRKK
jgi:hypothetical protein